MLKDKMQELKMSTDIFIETKYIGNLKERLELVKMYLETTKRKNTYSLIMNVSENNLIIEEQKKLIDKYSRNGEDYNICNLANDYLKKGNVDELHQIINIYIDSCNKQKIYELLDNPYIQFFRTSEEIIELAKLYDNILKTECFIAYVYGVEKYDRVSSKIINILIDSDKLIDKNYNFEMQKEMVFNYLEKNDFHIIDFNGKAKTKC